MTVRLSLNMISDDWVRLMLDRGEATNHSLLGIFLTNHKKVCHSHRLRVDQDLEISDDEEKTTSSTTAPHRIKIWQKRFAIKVRSHAN